MKSIIIFIAVLCTSTLSLFSQDAVVDRLLRDSSLQDSVIAAIVPNHTLMSKLIDKIAEDRQRHEMVIQHLTRLLRANPETSGGHDHVSHETMSHYAGDETREIKALSTDEIKELEDGEGMGLAMAAELNHYPGPRHILDMRDPLHLRQDQEKAIQAAFDRMHTEAMQLGRQLVEEERALDQAFASKTITPSTLKTRTSRIGDLMGRLRAVHLAAHLETRKLLSQDQIDSYDRLRGYRKQP